MSRPQLFIVVFGVILLGAASARAARQSVGAIAFGGPSVDPSALGVLQAQATAALIQSERLEGVDIAERLDTAGAAARTAAARQGRTKFQEARTAFDNLDLGAAARLFGESAQSYSSSDLSRFIELYVQSLIWQAASRWVNGDHSGARAGLVRAFLVGPSAPLDKTAFPPDLIEEAERDRRDTATRAKVALEVSSEPPGLVWIDGQLQGPSPGTFQASSGAHLVSVSAPGYRDAVERSSGPQARLRLKRVAEGSWLSAQRIAVAAAFETLERGAALKAVMDRLAVDQLLAVGVEEASLVAIRIAADGHVLAFVRKPLGKGAAVREVASAALTEALASDLPRGSTVEPVGEVGLEHPAEGSSGGGHGAAYTVGGIGLAALAAGTVFGIVELHDRGLYGATPNTSRNTSDFLESVGVRNGVVSDVLDGVGVLSLAVATTLWFLPKAKHASSDSSESLSALPVLWPGGGAVVLTGSF